MLKKRIVAVLPIKSGIVVQSLNFNRYLPVGKPKIAVEFLNYWGADEIVLLDLDASGNGRCISADLVQEVSKYTQIPLTVGGGIQNTEQMRLLLVAGADKISLNTGALEKPTLISQGAEIFGNQCIVVSIDVKRIASGKLEVFKNSGKEPTGLNPVTLAQNVEKTGAGEILLNSIDRDGSKQGYDLDLAQQVAKAVGIPVILCGGVGVPSHFVDGLKVPNISAVAASNFFHYQEHSVTLAKRFILNSCSEPIRLDSYVQYGENTFDENGRLLKKEEHALEKLFFEFHPKETI